MGDVAQQSTQGQGRDKREVKRPSYALAERPPWLQAVPPLATGTPTPVAELRFYAPPGTDPDMIGMGQALAEVGNRLLGLLRPEDIRLIGDEVGRLLGEDSYAEIDAESYHRLTGEPPPTREEQVALRMTSLGRAFKRRHDLLRDALNTDQVADLLGSRPTIGIEASDSSPGLLAVSHANEYLFPAWQFDADTSTGTLEGLAHVLTALHGVPALQQVAWFTTWQPELEMTPVESLRRGHRREVVVAAQGFARSTAGLPARAKGRPWRNP